MTMQRYLCAACLCAALAASGCGRGTQGEPAADELSGMIRVDGSSTVFPISEAVAEEFKRANPRVDISVGISGTGGGFQKFCRGETDISDASRPIRATEMETCQKAGIEFIELPVAYDGLAIAVNPKNSWATSITTAELRTLWEPGAQGKITRWSQVRKGWPDREIRLFGAGVDSGTFDYFTEAINGKEKASRGDFTSSEDDNVLVQGVGGDELALGFIPLAYVEQNKDRLKVVPVDDAKADNGNGPIPPSVETVRNGTYQPLSRPLFIYVARKSADRPEIQRFVESYFSQPELMREVGYVELTPQIYDLARAHFTERQVGTAFGTGGSQVGMTLEALLSRQK
ncbi:MAG TPA: PstS family phosphate ABC transporter substrate-binding protein [Vicinamibacterales bacterium]|nr:PstS family phosphate ABC transporter substrate-binding protein [Vicinamibacterales bacterium]